MGGEDMDIQICGPMMESVEAADGAADRFLGRACGDAAQGLFEYALIIALVAFVLVASLTVLGGAIGNQFLPAIAAL